MRLISLNIEGTNHFDRFLPLLKAEIPDVVCLQEVFESDVPKIESTLGMEGVFAPMTNFDSVIPSRIIGTGLLGVLILSREQPTSVTKHYYLGTESQIPSRRPDHVSSTNRVALVAKFARPEGQYQIVTTHYTWSPDGQPTDLQRDTFVPFTAILDSLQEFVLCGDLNCPRGTELWTKLAEKFCDNIPEHVVTTLDPDLHYLKGSVDNVVDCLFTTPGFQVREVRVVSGVSDHQAVVATILPAK